jgi:hypothetical protein
MPIVGPQQDRIADLLEELIDKLDQNGAPAEMVGGMEGGTPNIRVIVPKAEPPTVNVAAPEMTAPAVNVAPPQVTVTPKITVTPEVKAPAVHVTAPAVTVNPPQVTVEAPHVTVQNSSAKSWTFKVTRTKEGYIETITATPK